MKTVKLEPLFNPHGIAVFGANDGGSSVGSIVFMNLVAGGFPGPLVPVNPKHRKVGGKTCYRQIADVKEAVDLALIATPAKTVPGIVRQLGDAGIRHAIVLSAGFGESGEDGEKVRTELVEAANASGVRFLGPNCVGLVRPWNAMNATFLKSETPTGGLALVSQSGALISAISDWAAPHHLGFSALVSLGNSINVDFGDVLNFLAMDPKTRAILLYVEGVRDSRSFMSALRIAARLKPVIVLKAGRHTGSSMAAHTHTGALMGSDAVFDAALERAGAVRARSFGDLFAAAEILSAQRRSSGRRLGIITNGGGAGVLAADRAGDLNVELPPPSSATIAALDEVLPPFWSKSNPIDILGDATPAVYGTAVAAGFADPSFDGLLVMLTPQAMTDPKAAAQAVLDAVPPKSRKPVLTCWMGETSVAEARTLLSANGIPDFNTPEPAIEAFSHLARFERNQRLALETPGPLSELEPPDVEGARLIIAAALAERREMLSDIESKAVLRAFHIPCNTTLEATTAMQAVIAAETVGFPVAMKISSPQISHKSDVGGVRINIMSAGDVGAAFRELTATVRAARPDAEIRGVTVEAMAVMEDERELLIGISRDSVFGPTILFGAGGTMVEVLKDSSVSLPPLNAILAERLIRRTRVSRLMDAVRDRPAVDRKAVVDVLMRVSDMVCELPEIIELDINPLFAGPSGVIAVDARIRVARPSSTNQNYGHMAIVPYPRHLVAKHILSDGTRLTIRPIRPEDAQSEQAFVRHLSPEARSFRFMHAINELTPEMLVRFTQIDYSREMALVAITDEAKGPIQQGVARYVINPDETSCEFAIVVSDQRQRQGIGTILMTALMDAARGQGVTEMFGTVRADNETMLALMDGLGFVRRRVPDAHDIVEVERRL